MWLHFIRNNRSCSTNWWHGHQVPFPRPALLFALAFSLGHVILSISLLRSGFRIDFIIQHHSSENRIRSLFSFELVDGFNIIKPSQRAPKRPNHSRMWRWECNRRAIQALEGMVPLLNSHSAKHSACIRTILTRQSRRRRAENSRTARPLIARLWVKWSKYARSTISHMWWKTKRTHETGWFVDESEWTYPTCPVRKSTQVWRYVDKSHHI